MKGSSVTSTSFAVALALSVLRFATISRYYFVLLLFNIQFLPFAFNHFFTSKIIQICLRTIFDNDEWQSLLDSFEILELKTDYILAISKKRLLLFLKKFTLLSARFRYTKKIVVVHLTEFTVSSIQNP